MTVLTPYAKHPDGQVPRDIPVFREGIPERTPILTFPLVLLGGNVATAAAPNGSLEGGSKTSQHLPEGICEAVVVLVVSLRRKRDLRRSAGSGRARSLQRSASSSAPHRAIRARNHAAVV